MSKVRLFFGAIAIVLLFNICVFAQSKCLFIVASTSLSSGDQVLFDKLTELGYEIEIITPADVAIMFEEEFLEYDFMVASESIDSGGLNPIKTIPIPFVNLEGWCVKPGAMDWQTDRDVNNYPPEPVKIVDNTGHPLAAGFTSGTEVTLIAEGFIVASVPQIDIFPIAARSSDETKLVIYGIEAGTLNTVGDTIQSRVTTIGIHAEGYPSMTADAFKFFEAAIEWVTTEPTGIAEEQFMPVRFELAQNFPNPFNPTTTIEYTLVKNTQTEIVVYDLIGNKVVTLVDGFQNIGTHKVVWDASGLSAGVYIYQLKTEDFIESKKMILVK